MTTYGARLTLGFVIGSFTGAAGSLVPLLTDVYKSRSWKPVGGNMGWREVARAAGCFGGFFATYQARRFFPYERILLYTCANVWVFLVSPCV